MRCAQHGQANFGNQEERVRQIPNVEVASPVKSARQKPQSPFLSNAAILSWISQENRGGLTMLPEGSHERPNA